MRHVIVGAGPAGVIAAEHLRKCDPDCEIKLIGAEPEPPYSRMAIPYLLSGQIDETGTYLRKQQDHYEHLGISLLQGQVTGVDPVSKTVSLADGSSLPFEKLLIATGASPVSPPIAGLEHAGVHACWTLADARRIAARTGKGKAIVLIGAGFIGSIILEALAETGAQLTVVEVGDRMVPRMLNETAGLMLQQWCESRGVNVCVASSAQAIEGSDRGPPLRVLLDGGRYLDADLVITATGVVSNIAFLAGSGIDTERGVLVDDYLATSQPDIYAAGDAAQGRDFSTGEFVVQAIQPTAVEHGRIAAISMARGHLHAHAGTVNMNVLDTLGLVSTSFARWMGVDGGDCAEVKDAGRFRYLNLQFADDVLVGATSVGMTDHIGVLRGLIQSRTRLGGWKKRLAADPTRLMEAYLATTLPVGYNASVT
jgi:NAD(P)H-nitrite reductase large subunit